MMWIVYVVSALVALVVIMALIGLTLRPDHLAARQAALPRPPDQVYLAARARLLAEQAKPGAVPMVIDLDDPAAGRIISRIADDKLPYGGRWIVDVSASEGGSTVRVTEDGVIKNPLFRFLSRTVFSLTSGLEKYLVHLGQDLGTPVVPVPAAPRVPPADAT